MQRGKENIKRYVSKGIPKTPRKYRSMFLSPWTTDHTNQLLFSKWLLWGLHMFSVRVGKYLKNTYSSNLVYTWNPIEPAVFTADINLPLNRSLQWKQAKVFLLIRNITEASHWRTRTESDPLSLALRWESYFWDHYITCSEEKKETGFLRIVLYNQSPHLNAVRRISYYDELLITWLWWHL